MAPRTPNNLASVFYVSRTFEDIGATCPHCGIVAAGFKEIGVLSFDRAVEACGHNWRQVRAGYCRVCRGLVLGISAPYPAEPSVGKLLWPEDRWPDGSPPGLEDEIKKDYDEARSILALSPRAAATLARRCLQGVIRKKLEIKEWGLKGEIAKAIKKDELSKTTKLSLDHVKTIGDRGAHPIEDEFQAIIDVTAEQAAYTLQVLEMLFDDLYVKPARFEEMEKQIGAPEAGK